MGTGIFRPVALGLAALTMALGAAGCGGTSARSVSASSAAVASASSHAGPAFGWLRPAAAPRGWTAARIPDGATMPYPSGWRLIKTDPGTASAALFSSHDRMIGYLNLTPQDGGETLRNWTHFRIAHNADENDRAVKTIAAATRLRFRDGPGSCVQDSYTTTSRARYIEIACLLPGRRRGAVIVGAAPPDEWRAVAPSLERAISAITT